jgi:hypothetical protein
LVPFTKLLLFGYSEGMKNPNIPEAVREYLADIGSKGGKKGGRKGGRARTRAKIAAARRNGKLGGRPKKLSGVAQ